MDLTTNIIKEKKPVPNPDPANGRGGLSWQKIEGPFASKAATERRLHELLKESNIIED